MVNWPYSLHEFALFDRHELMKEQSPPRKIPLLFLLMHRQSLELWHEERIAYKLRSNEQNVIATRNFVRIWSARQSCKNFGANFKSCPQKCSFSMTHAYTFTLIFKQNSLTIVALTSGIGITVRSWKDLSLSMKCEQASVVFAHRCRFRHRSY